MARQNAFQHVYELDVDRRQLSTLPARRGYMTDTYSAVQMQLLLIEVEVQACRALTKKGYKCRSEGSGVIETTRPLNPDEIDSIYQIGKGLGVPLEIREKQRAESPAPSLAGPFTFVHDY